jgi:hypothetical protein
MALSSGKKITRRSWDVIPMPDTVIDRVNILDNDQPEQFTFTDRHGRLIGDYDLVLPNRDHQLPGVDGPQPQIDGPQIEIPGVDAPQIKDVDITPAEGSNADINDDPQTEDVDITGVDGEDVQIPGVYWDINHDVDNPATVEQLETLEQAATHDQPINPTHTHQDPTLRRSTRTKIQTRTYTPSMSGSKYSYAVTQLESDGS